MKEFLPINLLEYIFKNAFTESDWRDIRFYESNFINNAAIDFAREQYCEILDTLFLILSFCQFDFQIKHEILNASIPLKFFLLERLMVMDFLLRKLDLTSFDVPKNQCLGRSLVCMLEENWRLILHTFADQKESLTAFVKVILYKYSLPL